jgi:hypothetical protein
VDGFPQYENLGGVRCGHETRPIGNHGMRAIKTAQLRRLFYEKICKSVTHLSCYSEGSGVETMRPAFMIFFVVLHTPAGNKCCYVLEPILKEDLYPSQLQSYFIKQL